MNTYTFDYAYKSHNEKPKDVRSPLTDPIGPIYTDKGIGDVNSTAKGSGARFNTGKPDYSLIPLRLYAKALIDRPTDATFSLDAWRALTALARFQRDHNDCKALWEILDSLGFDGWAECARVFEYGKAKYAPWNWAKGQAWSVPLASAVRHLTALLEGNQPIDPESGLPHRGHVFCNIVMLLTFEENYPEGNDLPPPGLLP